VTLETTARIWYLTATLATALFIVHGSLVPYDFVSRDSAEVWRSVKEKISQVGPISRSDVIANWLLGVQLGFCFLGTFRIDQRSSITSLVTAVLLFPLCLLLSVSVEFAQLYCPARMCALSDIMAQAVGAISGFIVWILFGQRISNLIRTLFEHPMAGGQHGLRCLIYFGFLLFLQIMPADLTISPKMIYIRFRHGEVTLVPFADWFASSNATQHLTESLIHLILCIPLGVGLATWPGPRNRLLILLGGMVLTFTLEVVQIFVESRHPSTTEAIIGYLGIILGAMLIPHKPVSDSPAAG